VDFTVEVHLFFWVIREKVQGQKVPVAAWQKECILFRLGEKKSS
jgi:hypothetical protein